MCRPRQSIPGLILPPLIVAAAATLIGAAWARGQIVPPFEIGGNAGGVYIDADGTVRYRLTDADKRLEQTRARARSNAIGRKDEKLCYISLPKLFTELQSLRDAGKEAPERLRYLGGMTQLRYVFVYPDEKDLVIAGPYEPVDASNKLQPVGQRTGRPVLQLEDLIVALRRAGRSNPHQPFGCSIDPAPDALQKSGQVMRDYAGRTRRERMDAMAKALGPQAVSVFGMPADTRIAFTCLAADYKLKRISLGLEGVARDCGE
jgi:hypothetical protein